MSSSSKWTLDSETLRPALSRWRAHDPSEQERGLVDELLMDLADAPFTRGREDGDSGIWCAWAGFALVMYIPDRDTRMIVVVDINYG